MRKTRAGKTTPKRTRESIDQDDQIIGSPERVSKHPKMGKGPTPRSSQEVAMVSPKQTNRSKTNSQIRARRLRGKSNPPISNRNVNKNATPVDVEQNSTVKGVNPLRAVRSSNTNQNRSKQWSKYSARSQSVGKNQIVVDSEVTLQHRLGNHKDSHVHKVNPPRMIADDNSQSSQEWEEPEPTRQPIEQEPDLQNIHDGVVCDVSGNEDDFLDESDGAMSDLVESEDGVTSDGEDGGSAHDGDTSFNGNRSTASLKDQFRTNPEVRSVINELVEEKIRERDCHDSGK